MSNFVSAFSTMERKKYVIIMAAGHGTRMGASFPKQFMDLGGKPILRLTIEKFLYADPDIRVVTVLPKDFMKTWKDYCQQNGFLCPQILVEGGITRFHSVKNALEKVPDGVIVAIHDGVRPLVTPELIGRMFRKMESCRALIPVLPSVDTLKAIRKVKHPDGSETLETIPDRRIDRTEVYRAQTPQMFLSEDIKASYSLAYDTAFTDDASVAEKKGIPLSYIEGERNNLKITTPEDLDYARLMIKGEGDFI